MKTVNLPPYAPTLMESTRAIGYSIEAAIADVIDNSIAASASQVDIDFFPIGESYIAILDNGWGMTADELVIAMQYGSKSPLETRDEQDLGRYGLGMKTASLSQCRILTVLSKKSGVYAGAQWNLNHIKDAESWSLLILDEDEAKTYPSFEKLDKYENGTLVIWQDLDKFAVGESDIAEAFKRKMDIIREHLSLVFHRYLSGEPGIKKLDIRMNEQSVQAQDPFLIKKSTQLMDEEIIVVRGQKVRVKPYILPHTSKLTQKELKELGGKDKSILNNLYKWFIENNADQEGFINLPLLLIDDEADNASVNTNSEEKDPTAINKAIRNILTCFRQASYLGITATPFANIFIDPDTDESTRDLFPKDFLTVLPTPELYIGADKIFGNGDADEWNNDIPPTRTGGIYGDSIIPIENEEQQSFYVFKHKKELADDLFDLPDSMRKAIRYFVIACAISDIRKDITEHRSMLVNVSRYTKVQNVTADLIERYLNSIKSDLQNYAALPLEKAMKITNISALASVWDEFGMEQLVKVKWEEFLHDHLQKSAKRIEVRSVNQQHGASSLNYYEYKGIGMRVIAVGGNSLSRGLTLEGLCVSYFYRNTMMYDTLLQMGRWFGYRPNYDDLFRIWMGEDAIDWYGYITDAVNELKDELRKMKRQNQTPEEFGLKVRQAPGSLLITAHNKMRTATSVKRPITVSGRMIETPRLKGDSISIQENATLCKSFIEASIMLQRMLSKAKEIIENNITVDEYSTEDGLIAKIRSFAVFDYIKGILSAKENDYVINSSVLCAADYGAPQKRMRFVVVGVKRGISTKIALPKGHLDEDQYKTVREAISDLETVKPVYDLKDDQKGIAIQPLDGLNELAASLRDTNILKNHIITKTTDVAMERFKAIKQGQGV